MASPEVKRLVREIESSSNDNFVKFYIYSAILNSALTHKSFIEALPSHEAHGLTTISGDRNFSYQLNNQNIELINRLDSNDRFSIPSLIAAYFGLGDAKNYALILQKMRNHLQNDLSPNNDAKESNPNLDIYKRIDFKSNARLTYQLIDAACSELDKLFALIDSSGNTAVSGIAAVVGIITFFQFTLPAVFIGLSLVATGAAMIYLQLTSFNSKIEALESAIEERHGKQRQYETIYKDKGSDSQKLKFFTCIDTPVKQLTQELENKFFVVQT